MPRKKFYIDEKNRQVPNLLLDQLSQKLEKVALTDIEGVVGFIDPPMREALLSDIKNKVGYDRSTASYYSCRNTYYRQKRYIAQLLADHFGLAW